MTEVHVKLISHTHTHTRARLNDTNETDFETSSASRLMTTTTRMRQFEMFNQKARFHASSDKLRYLHETTLKLCSAVRLVNDNDKKWPQYYQKRGDTCCALSARFRRISAANNKQEQASCTTRASSLRNDADDGDANPFSCFAPDDGYKLKFASKLKRACNLFVCFARLQTKLAATACKAALTFKLDTICSSPAASSAAGGRPESGRRYEGEPSLLACLRNVFIGARAICAQSNELSRVERVKRKRKKQFYVKRNVSQFVELALPSERRASGKPPEKKRLRWRILMRRRNAVRSNEVARRERDDEN